MVRKTCDKFTEKNSKGEKNYAISSLSQANHLTPRFSIFRFLHHFFVQLKIHPLTSPEYQLNKGNTRYSLQKFRLKFALLDFAVCKSLKSAAEPRGVEVLSRPHFCRVCYKKQHIFIGKQEVLSIVFCQFSVCFI